MGILRPDPRAFDLVLADGLYLRAPFVSLLRRHHKHVLLVLKDERRDLLQDARGIFQGQVPEVFDDHPVTRRWEIENQGFREMTTDWHADHVYRHHPRAIEAFWLMIMLTINLFRAFWNLNLKPVLRQRHTQAYFVRRMAAELSALGSSP